MNDDLKDLFSHYPTSDTASDIRFMSELESRLIAVDLVKEQLRLSRTKSRKSIVAAAVTGFVFGVASAFLYPLFTDAIASWLLTASLPQIPDIQTFTPQYVHIFAMAFLALVGAGLSFTSYELSSVFLNAKKRI